MDMNGWTLIAPQRHTAKHAARIQASYVLAVSGDTARALSAAGGVAAYTNRDGAIALRAATENEPGRRRVTKTSEASAKFSLTQLRDLGYRPGQRFTVAQQGDLFVLTPTQEGQP
jgi:hypothetical protein